MKREPAWVAAIRLALLEGRVDTEGVIREANLVAGRERTVHDVLTTMADRGLLSDAGDDGYYPGRVLLDTDQHDLDFDRASDGGAHRWESAV